MAPLLRLGPSRSSPGTYGGVVYRAANDRAANDRAGGDRAGGDPGAEHLRRRAVEATGALAAAGVALTVLDGPAATACIARALDPSSPPRPAGVAAADEVITGGVP